MLNQAVLAGFGQVGHGGELGVRLCWHLVILALGQASHGD